MITGDRGNRKHLYNQMELLFANRSPLCYPIGNFVAANNLSYFVVDSRPVKYEIKSRLIIHTILPIG